MMLRGQPIPRRIARLEDLFDGDLGIDLKIVAIDIPIGLLAEYEIGGRCCDRMARKVLGKRASSVFPAPVRTVLGAASHEDACARSRKSSPNGKGISIQLFSILNKIKEVDDFLQTRPEFVRTFREVHPEVSFRELAGAPMANRKSSPLGREERVQALRSVFPGLDELLTIGRAQNLKIEDVVDAAVACWSAIRIAAGTGHSLPHPVPLDSTGLPMAIWV
jgi:predicted RNase H-like nuclease